MDVRGWQFLTMKAAETLCIVAHNQKNMFPEKKYLGNRPSKNHILKGFDHQICILTDIFNTVE